MRIFESMEVAGSALTAHRLWMDTISSNLANINTTRTLAGGPYKRRVPVFAEMVDKTIGGYQDIGGVRVLEIEEDQTPPRLVYQPEHPDANADGYMAFPNVNLPSFIRTPASLTKLSRKLFIYKLKLYFIIYKYIHI